MIKLTLDDLNKIIGKCVITDESVLICSTHRSKPVEFGMCHYYHRVYQGVQSALASRVEDFAVSIREKTNSIESMDPYMEKFLYKEQLAFERGRCYAFHEVLNMLDGLDSTHNLVNPYVESEDDE